MCVCVCVLNVAVRTWYLLTRASFFFLRASIRLSSSASFSSLVLRSTAEDWYREGGGLGEWWGESESVPNDLKRTPDHMEWCENIDNTLCLLCLMTSLVRWTTIFGNCLFLVQTCQYMYWRIIISLILTHHSCLWLSSYTGGRLFLPPLVRKMKTQRLVCLWLYSWLTSVFFFFFFTSPSSQKNVFLIAVSLQLHCANLYVQSRQLFFTLTCWRRKGWHWYYTDYFLGFLIPNI